MIVEFFVPGEIRGKGNSKSIVRSKRGRVFLVEPAKNKANAQNLVAMFSQHAPAKPLDGPVRATYQIQYAWRKGDSAKRRALGMVAKDTRPDLGQLEKQIDDACQAAGLIVDDSQIVRRGDAVGGGIPFREHLKHGKFHCDRPGVWVRIEPV